jgi:hypothetical protein
MRLTDFFDRVAVINLPDRTDRRREMEAELRRIGVDPGEVEFFAACRPDDPGPFESIGARGCFQSHRDLLASARGGRNLLLLEDDAAFVPDLPDRLPTVLEELAGREWSLCHLGHREQDPGGPLVEIMPGREVQMAHFLAFNGPAIGPTVDFLDGLLSRPPGHPDGGPMHVDGAYSVLRERHPEHKGFLAVPSLGGQRSSRSDIAPRQWFDRLPIVREAAGVARSLKRRLRA